MNRQRLDQALVSRKLVSSRSQAESYIKLSRVMVDGKTITKPGYFITDDQDVKVAGSQYVSRAALKLEGVAGALGLDFTDRVVFDVGSSTGGFTDYALKHGAKKVIAVDVGTDQLHPDLRNDPRVELHEKTDVRGIKHLSTSPDIVLIDVSFISLREILPHIAGLVTQSAAVIAMVKPQFEAGPKQVNKGVIKNDSIRREVLKGFESWAKKNFTISAKTDSAVAGSKGNLERFYLLNKV